MLTRVLDADSSFVDADESEDDDGDDAEDQGGEDQDMIQELELLRRDNALVDEDPASSVGNAPDDGAASPPSVKAVRNAEALVAALRQAGYGEHLDALQMAFPLTAVSTIATEFARELNIIDTYESLKESNDPAVTPEQMLQRFLGLPTDEAAPREAAEEDGMAAPARPLIQVVESENDGPSNSGHSSSSASSDGEESSSDSDDDDDGAKHKAVEAGEPDSDSDSDVDSDSDSSSDPESESESESGSDSDSDSSDDDDDDKGALATRHPPQPPKANAATGAKEGPGQVAPRAQLSRTQKRNARRRKRLLYQKSAEGHAADARAEKPEQSLQGRKEQLLRVLGQGQDQGQGSGTPESQRSKAGGRRGADEAAREPQPPGTAEADPDGRRSRVDVGAGRRLLFGALGLKAPKSKAEEEDIRRGLMKDVRPLDNARLAADTRRAEGAAPAADEEAPDEWRKHIAYTAVECCQEGVRLSEPPFPFQQRWDPQQQGRQGSNNKRKRKRGARGLGDEERHGDDSVVLCYDDDDDDAAAAAAAAGRRRKASAGAAGAEDKRHEMPALPADVGSLPALTAGEAREGMVVTWKQMTMSKATRWQPEVVRLTGTVLSGSNEANLHVLLAARDREVRERVYDAATGRRVYDKFEAPDLEGDDDDDDGEAGEDDGHRMVAWAEMGDARVLRWPAGGSAASSSSSGGQGEGPRR